MLAENAILTLYVNRKQQSRVPFTRIGRWREMTPAFYQTLLNDFRTLAQRLGMDYAIDCKTIEFAEMSQANDGTEAIIAHAYDKRGNELHLCYAAV